MGLHAVPMPPRKQSIKVFEKVLLATDFSEASERAQSHAISLTQCIRGTLIVLHVDAGTDSLLRYAAESPALVEKFAALRQAKQRELEETLRSCGLPYEVIMASGNVSDVLNRVVQENSIDVVVMGTHGRQGFAHSFLGSTAENVIRSSHCPVLTIGPLAPPAPETPLRNILYATDFSPSSEAAAAYAIFLAQQFNATLTALHVAPQLDLQEGDESRIETFRLNRLKALVPAEEWPDLEHVLAYGQPVDEIIRTAREQETDLIVLGIHTSVEFTSHIPARLSYQLLCKAPCPVLSILPSGEPFYSGRGSEQP